MNGKLAAIALILAPSLAAAEGNHAGGHGHATQMALGEPAQHAPTRTVRIVMTENHGAAEPYVFDQKELSFAAGETVRLLIVNEGEEEHEFVMDTVHAIAEHKVLMERFPEMEHDDANAVRLKPGEEAEIVWTFGEPGTFQFACLLPGHYDNGMHGDLVVN